MEYNEENEIEIMTTELYAEIIEQINFIEQKRLKILKDNQFDPHLAFRIIDRFGQGYITKNDIITFLKSKDYNVDLNDTLYLFSYRNKLEINFIQPTRKDVFYYENFLNILKPLDESILNKCIKIRRNFTGNININTLNNLASFFYQIIIYFKEIEEKKNQIFRLNPNYANDSLNYITGEDNQKEEIVSFNELNTYIKSLNNNYLEFKNNFNIKLFYLLKLETDTKLKEDFIDFDSLIKILSPCILNHRVNIDNIQGNCFNLLQDNYNLDEYLKNHYKELKHKNDNKVNNNIITRNKKNNFQNKNIINKYENIFSKYIVSKKNKNLIEEVENYLNQKTIPQNKKEFQIIKPDKRYKLLDNYLEYK